MTPEHTLNPTIPGYSPICRSDHCANQFIHRRGMIQSVQNDIVFVSGMDPTSPVFMLAVYIYIQNILSIQLILFIIHPVTLI